MAAARAASICGLRAARRCGRAADVVERGGAESGYARSDFIHQIGDQRVEDAVERLIDGQLRRGGGILPEHGVVEAAEERHAFANLCEGENAGVEAVVEVGGEVGDFVGEVDELGFERRKLVEEILGQLGMVGGGVVARVLDDAFAHGQGQVEAAKGRRSAPQTR